MVSVGIDLGTTYSSVAAYNPTTRVAALVPNEIGETVTPSVVSFDPSSQRVLVGRAAKDNILRNPSGTVLQVALTLGRTFAEADPAEIQMSEPEAWFAKTDKYRIRFAEKWLAPEEVAAFILRQLKADVERSIASPISTATIAIPAYYLESEKEAISNAARLAGFEGVTLLSAPVAAAIAYANAVDDESPRTCLVVRVGGGSADASVVRITPTSVESLGIDGSMNLGGSAFDNCITTWAISELERRFDVTIRPNTRAWFELTTEAERAKKTLTSEEEADLRLAHVIPGTPISLGIDRSGFEALIAPLVGQLISIVSSALSRAYLSASDIERVLFVGGGTLVPFVRASISELFREAPCTRVTHFDPDTCVARGAALAAARRYDEGFGSVSDAGSAPTEGDPLGPARRRLLELLEPGGTAATADELGPLPFRPPRAFLCHAIEDKPAVRRLASRLRTNGVEPWLDEESLLPGQNWRQEISKAMRASDAVLVCLSQVSVNKAGYVQKEIREALDILDLQPEGAIFVIPVRLEDCLVPARLEPLHRADLFAADGYGRLVRALRVRAETR